MECEGAKTQSSRQGYKGEESELRNHDEIEHILP